MIKIEKDLNDIPDSLIPAFAENFPKGKIPTESKTTHRRRMELIKGGKYRNEDSYNARYKCNDIKKKLRSIYYSKCAYCEQKVEQFHIEHYRPKKIYPWLAYSWDNLLLSCASCNTKKGDRFEIDGNKCHFVNNPTNIKNINKLSTDYDSVEQPKLVNPERFDPSPLLTFSRDGKMDSEDPRLKYTIDALDLNRKYLNDERRKILENFRKDIRFALLESNNTNDQGNEIELITKFFIRASEDQSQEYIALRKYAISQWLNDIVKEVLHEIKNIHSKER